MEPMYYIGLDVHNQKISYCVKDRGAAIGRSWRQDRSYPREVQPNF